MTRHQRIKDQLGMPHGTASNRLRKSLLFKYVQKARENFCHVCGTEIELVDDLSIEHIKPWEGRDADLFWDLDNIAFSHRDCNRNHSYNGKPPSTKKCSGGLYWCWKCQQCMTEDKFNKNRATTTGIEYMCRQCRSRLYFESKV